MKKLFICVLLSITIANSSLFSSSVLADSFSNSDKNISIEKFEITGGISKSKNTEATFDNSRVITGTAEKDTNITITINRKNSSNELIKLENHSLKVGSSGYFSQSIDLLVGENYITIVAEKNNKKSATSTTINRKKNEIKEELKQIWVLPTSMR